MCLSVFVVHSVLISLRLCVLYCNTLELLQVYFLFKSMCADVVSGLAGFHYREIKTLVQHC